MSSDATVSLAWAPKDALIAGGGAKALVEILNCHGARPCAWSRQSVSSLPR